MENLLILLFSDYYRHRRYIVTSFSFKTLLIILTPRAKSSALIETHILYPDFDEHFMKCYSGT